VRNLRDRTKQALSDLEKQEIHKREEDWFQKKGRSRNDQTAGGQITEV